MQLSTTPTNGEGAPGEGRVKALKAIVEPRYCCILLH